MPEREKATMTATRGTKAGHESRTLPPRPRLLFHSALAVELAHTCGGPPECVIRMTPVGGCVIHIVQRLIGLHDSIVHNMWIRTCDSWEI